MIMKKLLITCEHASCDIPKEYLTLFRPFTRVLQTHKGWDIGALEIYNALIEAFPQSYQQRACWSRLLIDLNRSLNHKNLFSGITKSLSKAAQQDIIRAYYEPYRRLFLTNFIKRLNSEKQVVHIAVHSFTPILNGKKRIADIGILYDPARPAEVKLARAWRLALQAEMPTCRIRMNYPYWGKTDGFCTAIRKQYSNEQYIGIELETNQALFKSAKMTFRLKEVLVRSLQAALRP
ncbi:MAG: N-formylglutamate amidohydrolase [Gammaproteobacteria bacterium]